jgi:hypothetical protein
MTLLFCFKREKWFHSALLILIVANYHFVWTGKENCRSVWQCLIGLCGSLVSETRWMPSCRSFHDSNSAAIVAELNVAEYIHTKRTLNRLNLHSY